MPSCPERVRVEAAEPLGRAGVPGDQLRPDAKLRRISGTVTLRISTLCAVVTDVLERHRAFRLPAHRDRQRSRRQHRQRMVPFWNGSVRHRGCQVKWHNWWNAPKTWAKVQAIDPVASHASWMENFPWTRLGNVAHAGRGKADDGSSCAFIQLDPAAKKALLGDGNYGGLYQRSDKTRAALGGGRRRDAVADCRRMGLSRTILGAVRCWASSSRGCCKRWS